MKNPINMVMKMTNQDNILLKTKGRSLIPLSIKERMKRNHRLIPFYKEGSRKREKRGIKKIIQDKISIQIVIRKGRIIVLNLQSPSRVVSSKLSPQEGSTLNTASTCSIKYQSVRILHKIFRKKTKRRNNLRAMLMEKTQGKQMIIETYPCPIKINLLSIN